MGDRGNVRLEYGEGHQPIYLYTHWQGTFLPQIVAEALDSPAGRDRWNDPSYLARIIFNRMTRGFEADATGYGISPYQADWNHPDVVVNLEAQTVDGYPYEEFIRHNKEATHG